MNRMYSRFSHIFNASEQNILILFGIIFTFLTPIHGMLATIGMFVIIDTIFAIYVAVKQGGWAKYSSHKLFNFCPKAFFYLSVIIMGFLVDKFLLDGKLMGINLLISKFCCFFFIYIEIKSIDESSMKLGNRSLWVIIKEMLVKFKEIKKDINDAKKDE